MPDITDYFIGKFRESLRSEDGAPRYSRPRPYRNASVRFRSCSINDYEARRDILVGEAGLNPFMFRADMIPGCDLLSDSGTTTMTIEQWAEMMLGDEAYGSNEGYFRLKDQITETFGPGWCDSEDRLGGSSESLFIFHQGRAAENALFSIIARRLRDDENRPRTGFSDALMPELRERIRSKLDFLPARRRATDADVFMIPSNSHFDTTQGNIEHKRMVPLNLPCREHIGDDQNFPFRGNMDLEELENLLAEEGQKIPLVYLTITNNTGGGQPVSMANIQRIREITGKYDVPFFFDACRFAENAWFIQKNEDGYSGKEIIEIVHEMFSYVDGFHISLKKDGLVNMGGALVLRDRGAFKKRFPGFAEEIVDHQIMTEGHPTYGGLPGRDLKAICIGLKTVVRQDYLDARIGQVARFGAQLARYDIPIIRPVGGHAVYIDVDRFFDGEADDEDLKGISFTALMLIAGHRVCELGIYAFGSFDGSRETPPDPRVNYIRAAIPRLTYEDQDLYSAVEAVKVLSDNRDLIPGVNVDYGRELSLRHFKSRFSFRTG